MKKTGEDGIETRFVDLRLHDLAGGDMARVRAITSEVVILEHDELVGMRS